MHNVISCNFCTANRLLTLWYTHIPNLWVAPTVTVFTSTCTVYIHLHISGTCNCTQSLKAYTCNYCIRQYFALLNFWGFTNFFISQQKFLQMTYTRICKLYKPQEFMEEIFTVRKNLQNLRKFCHTKISLYMVYSSLTCKTVQPVLKTAISLKTQYTILLSNQLCIFRNKLVI